MTLVFGVLLLVAVLVSGWAHRTVLSMAVVFLVAGILLGPGVANVVHVSADTSWVAPTMRVALFAVLFTDGQRVSLRQLSRAWRLPSRALLLGLPVTLAISTVFAMVLLHLSLPEALLVSAVLAPTDPVFASAIVGRQEIPPRIRGMLNVESGFNDGLALPLVVILLAVVGGTPIDPLMLSLELVGGVVIGLVVPALVASLLRLRFISATPLYTSLMPVAVALIIFGACQLTGANLYLAAFTGGITLASVAKEARDAFARYGEYFSELVKLFAIFLFGALIHPSLFVEVPPAGYLFAVLLLLVARPAAVELALVGSKLPWAERLTAAWFGPKGFASVLYGFLVLHAGGQHSTQLVQVIVLAIALSIIAHSSTDVPIAAAFARHQEKSESAVPGNKDHRSPDTSDDRSVGTRSTQGG